MQSNSLYSIFAIYLNAVNFSIMVNVICTILLLQRHCVLSEITSRKNILYLWYHEYFPHKMSVLNNNNNNDTVKNVGKKN